MADKLAVIQSDETKRELLEISNSTKALVRDFKDLVKESNRVNQAFNAGRPREYAAAISDLRDVTSQYTAIERQLADSMMRVARLEAQQARTAAETARTRQEVARALREESRARQQTEREQRSNTVSANQNNSAHRQLTLQVRAARQTARDYGAQLVQLNERLRDGSINQREYRNQSRDLQRNFQTTTIEANRLQASLNRLNQATTPSGNRNGSLFGRVTDILKAFGIMKVIDMAASSIINLGKSAISTAIKLDTLRIAQLSVFKTSDEVSRQNEFLTGIAERYGIEIIGLTEAYTKFSASAQGTYLEGEKSKQIFDAVTKSSSMLGVSTDETTGILKALGQMMSKGKVQAEELRGQLGDRMAGAFKLFADGMGVSTSELDAMLKKGTVLAEDVLPKFATQLNKKYTLGIGDEINTNQANLNRISNEWVLFVEAVESKSGIVAGSIRTITGSVVSLLQALKPSQEITAIKQQQQELNILGIQLRQNWDDQKKRKEIIDQIISVNPLFLQGLDREKVTLEEISKRLQDVNAQYVQKKILQEQEEKIKELIDDQAIAMRDLSMVLVENAQDYNSLNIASKNAIDQYVDGAINQQKASDIIRKSTVKESMEQTKSINILRQLASVKEVNRLTSDGFIRSLDNSKIAIEKNSIVYNGLVSVSNRVLGVQGQLLDMNGRLAASYDKTGKKIIDQKKKFEEIFKVAEGQGKSIALINNVWRQKINGKWTTTDKKETEGWYEEYGKLVKKKSQEISEKVEKPKRYKASNLNGVQKDYLKDLQTNRDLELALNETQYVKGLKKESEYLNDSLKINNDYFNKKISYLKGKNTEERKQRADAILDQAKMQKEIQKKVFDIERKQIDENYKKQSIAFDRRAKFFENSEFEDNSGRLESEIALNEDRLESAKYYYNNLIDTAKKANQDILEIERKRDDEIGNIEDELSKKISSRLDAYTQDLEISYQTASNSKILNFEEQRSLILSNKKLTNSERDYQLSILEKNNQIELNKLDIIRLNTLKNKLSSKKFITKEDEKKLSEYTAQIKALENINIELNAEVKNDISDKLQKTIDIITSGLNNLGLDNTATAFEMLFKEIKAKTADWADYMNGAFALVADYGSKYIEKQKEQRLSALDEELKQSQENTDQEIGFIEGRLDQLNALEELTAEQITERNSLEDEARTYKEQQQQREKLIAAQKARAEQKAASQQALINGALAATMTLAQLGFAAGAIPAALALAFGVAQSISISSKDPVPQYFVGTSNAKRGWALTQERGAEIHTDKNDSIISLGSNRGAHKTWMEAGDKVYTASETSSILKKIGGIPKIGENIFQKIALSSLKSPEIPIIINNNGIDYDKLGSVVAEKYEKIIKAYDKPYTEKIGGKIIRKVGRNLPVILGTYDLETLKETYYKNDSN